MVFDCNRFMDNGKEIFEKISPPLMEKKIDGIENVHVQETLDKYAGMMVTMDAIWSCVRGRQQGLLPTEEDIAYLTAAVAEGRRRWLELNITTLQPKWHYTFDGHLVDQVKRFQGLADKGDDPIEKGHQVWNIFYDRFCRIVSFSKREKCIRKAEKRSRHPAIEKEIELFHQERKKHSETSNRKRRAREGENELKEMKRVKREAIVLQEQQQQDVP